VVVEAHSGPFELRSVVLDRPEDEPAQIQPLALQVDLVARDA
jgi:hypothetical protein